jgi:signal peptidase II
VLKLPLLCGNFLKQLNTLKRSYLVAILILGVLVIDQWSKFYIKTHFEYNEDMMLFGQQWARLHFVENEGMAFGITFDWTYGKLLLSLFRILMVGGLFWYLSLLIRHKAHTGFLVSVSLITAGAIGNILDSAFYGMIFTESPYYGGLAQLVSPGQGYGTFLHGKVVDMLYFPIKWISVPEWMPLLGGREYLFFSPIFNVADASITCGVFAILLFQRSFFREPQPETQPASLAQEPEAGSSTPETEEDQPVQEADSTDTVVDAADEAPKQQ